MRIRVAFAFVVALGLFAPRGDAVENESVLNRRGYDLLRKGDVEGAIRVFQRNVEAYPDSANVHDSLGEAYERAGRKAEARASYEMALKIGTERNDPNVAVFRENAERVK